MRNKVVFAASVFAAFFIGGAVANMDLLAEATNGNGDGAWAKLVARVTGLEEQLDGNTIKTVVLNDDEAGHAAGWDPADPSNVVFLISDADIKNDSIVYAQVPEADVVCDMRRNTDDVPEGQMLLFCLGNIQDGQKLHYVIINQLPS